MELREVDRKLGGLKNRFCLLHKLLLKHFKNMLSKS